MEPWKLQVANFTFAAGQVGYKHVMQHYQSDLPGYRTFGYFFFGALIIALPSFLIFGNADKLPTTSVQWGILVWLGLAASGMGLFLWVKPTGGRFWVQLELHLARASPCKHAHNTYRACGCH